MRILASTYRTRTRTERYHNTPRLYLTEVELRTPVAPIIEQQFRELMRPHPQRIHPVLTAEDKAEIKSMVAQGVLESLNSVLQHGTPSPSPATAHRIGITELSRQISLSPSKIRKDCRAGKLPFERSGGKEVLIQKGKRQGLRVYCGGKLLFDPAAVDKAMLRHRVKAVGD